MNSVTTKVVTIFYAWTPFYNVHYYKPFFFWLKFLPLLMLVFLGTWGRNLASGIEPLTV